MTEGDSNSVMVVDDSAMSRRMMRRILEQAGFVIVEESNGAAALARYASERPSLVMLDLIMPGMYGMEVLTGLLQMDPTARVIVASADLQQATQDDARTAGALGFVTKPFVATDVLRVVAAVRNGTIAWT